LKESCGIRILEKGLRWKKFLSLSNSPNGSTGSPLYLFLKLITLYILLCDKTYYYVGITSDLENRVFQHSNKLSFYTKRFNNIEVVYTEKYLNLKDAEKREMQIKKWSKAKKKSLIEENISELVSLSKHS